MPREKLLWLEKADTSFPTVVKIANLAWCVWRVAGFVLELASLGVNAHAGRSSLDWVARRDQPKLAGHASTCAGHL